MATIKEEAISYQPQQLDNIATLDNFSIDFEVYEKKDVNSGGEEYTYKYIELNGMRYRIPNSVLEEIQKILKLKPEAKNLKVFKTGEGLKTRYSVELIS